MKKNDFSSDQEFEKILAELYKNTSDPSVFTEAALSPIYLRKSQAEREREERIAKEESAQKGE